MKTTFRFFILLLALVPGCMLAGPPTNNPTANVRMVAVDTAGNLYGPSTNLFKKNLGLVQASGIFANGTNGVITAPAGSAGGSVDLGVGGNGGPTEDGQSNQSDGGAGGTVNLATGGAGGGGSDGNGGTVNLATTRFGAPGRVNAGYLAPRAMPMAGTRSARSPPPVVFTVLPAAKRVSPVVMPASAPVTR